MDWRNLGRPCHIDGGGRGLLESLYYEMGSRGEILGLAFNICNPLC